MRTLASAWDGDRFGSRVLSQPMRLHWAGWTTDTHTLQRNGWELSAHQDIPSRQVAIAVRHREWEVKGLSRIADYDFYEAAATSTPSMMARPVDVHLGMRMGRDVHVHMPALDFHAFDAIPRMIHDGRFSRLEDIAHFAAIPQAVPVVIPEEDVDQLLARILEKQQAAKTAYFRDLVQRDNQVLPAHRVHAQLITLAA